MNKLIVIAALLLSTTAWGQSKTVQVSVINPVLPVEVSNADPIPVIDAAGIQPIAITLGTSGEYQVPVGKMLVIEHVSGISSLPNGTQGSTDLQIRDGVREIARHRMFVTKISESGTASSYLYSAPIKIYLAAGITVRSSLSLSGSSDGFFSTTVLSGYLTGAQ